MIKAITFDFWNTLYNASSYARPLRMRFLAERLTRNQIDLEPEQIETAEGIARDEWNRIWREDYRTPSSAEWLHWMFDDLDITLPRHDLDALADYFDRSLLEADPGPTLIDGAADTIRRLAQRYRLGIISDSGLSTGRTLREVIRRDGLLDCFACQTFSDELGVSKPHARAFRSTLDCLGVSPAEAVHLGDLIRSDIAGAKLVGMQAVRFAANYNDPDRSVEPEAVVRSYAEFERWLEWQTKHAGPPWP
ncbi:MAG TPA: HAD family hydrolase [Anaerolineae bacterium]